MASTAAHFTSAETLAVPFNVNVHVFFLLPPLEQAPDQMASRPLLTESVMLVPGANSACIEPPTATLIPDGLDVTRSPLRPLAVTVRATFVGGGGGGGTAGFTHKGVSTVRPPAVAKIVIPVDCVTVATGTVNAMFVSPAGTVIVAGTVAIGLLLDSDAVNPPAGAGLDTARIAIVEVPPVTTFGNMPMLNSAAGGGGGSTPIETVREEPL